MKLLRKIHNFFRGPQGFTGPMGDRGVCECKDRVEILEAQIKNMCMRNPYLMPPADDPRDLYAPKAK